VGALRGRLGRLLKVRHDPFDAVLRQLDLRKRMRRVTATTMALTEIQFVLQDILKVRDEWI
jgi:hypothetical protein